jgi:molecular chaperone GrpE
MTGETDPQAPETTDQTTEVSVEDLLAQLNDLQSRFLRLAADYENFRRRARQEQLETADSASARVAERLLPVLDDAERAMEHVPAGVDETWLAGLQLTLENLRRALAATGVEPIEAVGRQFDPRLHQAVGTEESSQHPEGAVASELNRGYRLHDRVLRPSLVRVARRPQPEPPDAQPPPSGT